MSIFQLKIITGEEIICDLVTSEINEYDEEVLFLRNAFSLVCTEDFDQQVRFYTLRPFMMHQYESNKLLALQSGAVLCSVVPDKKVLAQYETHIEQYVIDDEDSSILDDEAEDADDSTDPNIIKFNPKLH